MSNLDLGFYLSLLRKRAPLFIAIVTLVTAAGLCTAYLLPPVYRATAKILVESAQIPSDVARSTVPPSPMEQLQIVQEDVLSQAGLVELAGEFHLYSPLQLAMQSDVADDMRDRILIQPVSIDGAGRAGTMFEVSFDARDPKLAADVANRLVSMILEKDTRLRTARATDTVQFFTQEATRLDTALKELEQQILAFKNANNDSLPESLGFRRDQQTAQQQRLLLLTQEEASLRQRMADLRTSPLSARGPLTPEEKALDDLRTALATQLEAFSETSPTIVAIRSRIATLESQIAAKAGTGESAPGAETTSDPQYNSLVFRLREVEKEAATIQQSIDALSASILATAATETTLGTLERNHQNLQAQYDAAIMRLAEASTGQQIEFRLKGERLSLIASALPPQKQISPKRMQIVLMALFAALGLGAAAVAVPEFLNNRVRRPIELVNKLDIRPIVTVPYISPPASRWHRPPPRPVDLPDGLPSIFRARRRRFLQSGRQAEGVHMES